jgi:hypothetical protein
MTTVAYCLKSKTVATDSRIVDAATGELFTDTASKRYQRGRITLFMAGAVCDFEEVANTFIAGKHGVRKSLDVHALIWTGEKLFEVIADTGILSWHPVVADRGAIGSGASYAQAALDAGATPFQAVKAAAKRNVFTGGKIVLHRLDNRQ